ncbi:MAG: hypothetical protein BWY98_00705 [Tenericutes bacterium ADurb.BinA155]|jgi:hypothetical protein|nr:MAG: hypothetical protein BWY98_00705 [Tenericutes bacterium ADurb.BinA155]
MSISKKKPVDRFFTVGIIMLIATIALILISLIWIPFNTKAGQEGNWGWAVGVWYWWDSFAIDLVQGKTQWTSENVMNWLLVALTLASAVATILLLILYIRQKEKKGAIAAVLAFITILVLGIVYSTVSFGLKLGVCVRRQYDLLWIIEGCGFVALLFLVLAAFVPFLAQTFASVSEPAKVEEKKEEEKPAEKPAEEAKPAEEKKEEKPAEQKPVVVVIKQEVAQPAPAVAPAEKKAPVIAAKGKARRRASFETKVKNADEDLRHKYYELRDYIKSYGVHNRVSIPGDTFSAHRQRYVFITISGKHMKVSYDLNPNSYKDSTIPVEFNKAKKFADLALLFKVRSDLSLKRAEQLVDDIMASKGVKKPEPKKPADDKAAK